MASFAEFTKKKKKQSLTGDMSFRDYTETMLGIDLDNIAPVRTTVEPISTVSAPVKKEEKEEKLDFFQKGAFKNGYQFGDVTKTILGTAGDAGLGVLKGAGSLVEGVGDFGLYGVAGVADLVGADKFAGNVKKFAQKNSIQENTKGADDFLNNYSVLGRTSDAVAQGTGQIGALIGTAFLTGGVGLGAVGGTALTTGIIGASSAGSGMSEAYQGGATDGEAVAYGVSKGVIDAGTELLFGGLGKAVGAVGLSKGISSLDDVFARKLSEKVSNQVAKNAIEFGVKASGEGFEELLAGVGTAVAKDLTYKSEEELLDLIEDENLLEQFVVGTVTSGMIQSGYIPKTESGSLKEANATGRDFITGYTQNEQAVIDKVVEQRVKEQETDGKKLNKKEIGKIEEEVATDLQKGNISTDTIESVLGGNSFKTYNSLVERENTLKKEIEALENMPNEKITVKENERLKQAREELNTLLEKTDKDGAKQRLTEEVNKLIENDTFLKESYNEKNRRSQQFEADLTKYDEKQQEVIKRAVDSGILNNTNKTHEFVDMIAKLSADKGVLFDFTNNDRLKESGFAIEGKTINGYVKDGNIALNINSQKALNTVVGHEITHVLEGTDLYNELQTAITEYAKTKGEYDSRFEAIQKLYEGVDNVNLENEITADLVGDYLFTDSDFINNLSTTKPNVFKRIYDEIKYFLKIATAGSKEAKELEKVKRAFDKAYKANSTTSSEVQTAENADIQHSLSEDMSIEDKINSSMTMKEAKDMLQRVYNAVDIRGYKNADEWLNEAGSDEVAMTIESEYALYKKYIEGNEDILNEEYYIQDVLDAYLAGTLVGSKKEGSVRLDTSRDTGFKDSRFYAPQDIKGGIDLYNIANQRVTNANREEVYKARADFIINAHNNGYIESLGLTREEVNKKLKSWANYTKKAMELANSLNAGVSTQNRWAGIENSTILNTISVTNEEMSKLVKSIEGDNSEWQRQYITSTMLALDTHIDYKELSFVFNGSGMSSDTALGEYVNSNRTIYIRHAGQNTVAHEIGHYIDHRWGRDLGYTGADGLTGRSVKLENLTPEQKQFVKNFYNFLSDIENTSDIGSAYKQSSNEVFARFVARFTEWTKNQATNNRYGYEDKWYKDNFNERQYREFVKILQEKAMLDTSNAKYSLSVSDNSNIAPTGKYNVYGKDIALETVSKTENVAPLVQEKTDLVQEVVQETDEYAPMTEAEANERDAMQSDRLYSLDESDMPEEVEAPYSEPIEAVSPFDDKDIQEVGDRKQKAYMYENPEVKPYFQEEAQIMLGELRNSVKGERVVNADLLYESGGEFGVWGTKRETSEQIAYMLDRFKYSYADIEKGLNAIIEDHGAENNAISKRLEFMIDERLREGHTDFLSGMEIPSNQDYINLLRDKQINNYSDEAYNQYLESLASGYVESAEQFRDTTKMTEDIAPTQAYEAIEPQDLDTLEAQWAKNKMVRADSKKEAEEIAKILDEEPVTESKRNSRKWAIFKANVLDKGAVFEDLALKNKNRELMGKWNYTLYSESRAQRLMGEGDAEAGVKSLNDIIAEVENTGLKHQFYEYVYHKHNIDRMSLEAKAEAKHRILKKEIERLKLDTLSERQLGAISREEIKDNTTPEREHLINTVKEYLSTKDVKNKPVFGYSVTAEMSKEIVDQYEFAQPEFMDFANDLYKYNTYLRQQLVDNGVISQETADLWNEMYPHYVPVRRINTKGLNINVPLDTGRTGVNAPVKGATGGNANILPLFDTMAMRTLQTYKATAKNSFGVELKNTLGTVVDKTGTNVDEVIESIDAQEELLQEGKNGQKPTFTVFQNGERVTYEITEDMYDALKPLSDSNFMSKTIKPLNVASNFHRGLLTEYNPVFIITNGIKDIQDVLINSQHPGRTYTKIPEAFAQLTKKGYWYNEYMNNGGDYNSYFDSDTNTFKTENKGLAKVLDLPPFSTISKLNNYVEMIPRLAEYIASREAGRSVEVSMLDSARVTTNFRAGGDLTKWANRNGATFLNASVQGAMQQVRNIREAKMNGFKGWANLATKFALAGAPAFLLNALMWDDDEEYEELSDYVKQNYYIVGKYDDGKFIRIPKGRTVAVIQDAIKQVSDTATGNDEADLKSFLELVVTNIAPANPIESNILAPIIQVKNNETWYGEDLVPTRLQDLPASEQFDESTDSISKWLGEKLDISPVKINYLLDQYTGGVGDVVLPMLTPEAESGDNSTLGNAIAPLKKKFTVDSVMNNQNVSDFYDTSDELTTNAKMSTATDEDILKNKYINSVKGEMSDLYKRKRELQNSDLPDSTKYERVREIQSQIVELSKEGLKSYKGVTINGDYGTVGDRHYKRDESGEWKKLTDKQLEKQNEVTSGLGISASDYWSNKDEYDFAYEKPEKYAISKVFGGYDAYKTYSAELEDIKADKDENGKTITGSRKEKVLSYVNNLDADYGTKIILFKSVYNADDDYNNDIIEYLDSRNDISYEEEVAILKELGFTVESDGTIYW